MSVILSSIPFLLTETIVGYVFLLAFVFGLIFKILRY